MYRSVIGGLALAAILLCFAFLASPIKKAEVVFLPLAAGIGCVTTYLCQRSSSLPLSLIKNAAIGSLVGLTAGIVYFVIGMIVFLLVTNANIAFSSRRMSLAVIGVIQLTVASALGGLMAGLWSRWRSRMSSGESD